MAGGLVQSTRKTLQAAHEVLERTYARLETPYGFRHPRLFNEMQDVMTQIETELQVLTDEG